MNDQAPEPVDTAGPVGDPAGDPVGEPIEAPEPTVALEATPPQASESEPRRSGFHPVTVGHLVMSLIFLCVFVLWVVLQAGGIKLDDLRWAIPFPFLVAGSVGLVAAAINARRRGSR